MGGVWEGVWRVLGGGFREKWSLPLREKLPCIVLARVMVCVPTS